MKAVTCRAVDNGQAVSSDETIETLYDQFRPFALSPFDSDFDVAKWLAGTKAFNYFGIGLATIYLNRVDKKRFPILNNKTADSLALFDIALPSDIVKRYKAVLDAQKQLIDWFPSLITSTVLTP